MNLSSLRRLLLYVSGDSSTLQPPSVSNNRILLSKLPGVSADIESYLRRKIRLDQYTDYIDTKNAKIEFFVEAPPVISLIDVFEDPRSLWIGQERQVQYAFTGQTKSSIINPYAMNYVQEKALRVRYVGGISRHAANSRYSLSSATGTFAVNQFVQGQGSNAVGVVNSLPSGAIIIECYYGIFFPGEQINQYPDETFSTQTASGIISLYPEYGFIRSTGTEVYTVGQYCLGLTSGNTAKIVAIEGSPTSGVTLSNNTILDSEAVNVCEDAGCTAILFTNQFFFINNRSLVETAPEIVDACEMQVRYDRKHALDYENTSSDFKGVSRRRGKDSYSDSLIEEAKSRCNCWRMYHEY